MANYGLNVPPSVPRMMYHDVVVDLDKNGGMNWTHTALTGPKQLSIVRSGKKVERPLPFSGTDLAYYK